MTVTFCPFSKASGNLTECMFGLMVRLLESWCAKTIFGKTYTLELQQNHGGTVVLQILLRTQHSECGQRP